MKKYVNDKQNLKQKIYSLPKLFLQYWPMAVASGFTILSLFLALELVDSATLENLNDTTITAASIITAIIITILVAKVIQLRQEKLSQWDKYRELTQQINHFRAAVLPLLREASFWPTGLHQNMNTVYKNLDFYECRKIVFVNHTPMLPLATQFIQENSGMKNFFIQLRALYSKDLILEYTILNSEFEMPQNYRFHTLMLWAEFDVGNGLWYYFRDQWAIFGSSFSFHNISVQERREILNHCLALDFTRYQNMTFGKDLYVSLGQQFTDSLLPQLYRLAMLMEGIGTNVITSLIVLMQIQIIGCILVPIFVKFGLLDTYFTSFSISLLIGTLLYVGLSLGKMLSRESNVYSDNDRWHR